MKRRASFLYTPEMKSPGRCQFWEQYLLILIGSDSCEDSFRKGECFHSFPRWNRLDGREIISTIFTDDVDPRLVFVHRMKNNLWQGKKSQIYQELLPNINSKTKHLMCKIPVGSEDFQECRSTTLMKIWSKLERES